MPRKAPLPTADDFFRVPAREPEPAPQTVAPPLESAEETIAEVGPAPVVERRPARPRKARTARPAASTPPDIAPPAESSTDAAEKVTFYLPRSLLKSLEVVRVRVLMDHDVKITRSQIAEAVITTALVDVDALERLVLDRLAGESGT